jgi:hypothetical protein
LFGINFFLNFKFQISFHPSKISSSQYHATISRSATAQQPWEHRASRCVRMAHSSALLEVYEELDDRSQDHLRDPAWQEELQTLRRPEWFLRKGT